MRQTVLGIVLAGLVSTSAFAQAPTPATLNFDGAFRRLLSSTSAPSSASTAAVQDASTSDDPVPVSVSFGIDFPTVYFFRGIRQEADPQFTAQPFGEVDFTAGQATLKVGSWNSLHSGSNDGFYESDIYAGVSYSVVSLTYTAYTSPNDSYGTVHELAVGLGYDDSSSPFPVGPSATLAFELGKNGADGGDKKGIYLELGAAPGIPLTNSPVAFSIPIKVGLSLKDYYQNPETGKDDKFGYFSIGVNAAVAMGDHADIHGSVTLLAFPDNFLRLSNNGNSTETIGSIGLGFSF
jgi:hypothetical protein